MLSALKSTHPLVQFLIYTLIGGTTMMLLAVFAMVVYVVMSGTTLDLLGAGDLNSFLSVDFLKVLQMLQAIGLFIVPYLIYKWANGKDTAYALFPSVKPLLFISLFAATIFCAYPLINALAEWNQGLTLPDSLSGLDQWMHQKEAEAEALIEQFLVMDSVGDLALNLLVIAILPAIGEELFFRGMMQSLFHKWFKNEHIAVWVVAIFFSAFHMQFLGFVPRMLLGAVLGYATVYSGSLIVPIVGHFVNNGLAVILTFIYGVEAMSSEANTLGSSASDWVFILVSAALLVGGVIWMRNNRDRSKASMLEA